jgi:acyl-CoA hydrolase
VTPPRLSPEQLLDQLRPGHCVYIPGSSGELRCLQQWFSQRPASLSGVTLVSCLLPGINGFDYAALNGESRLETYLLPPALRPSFLDGRVSVLPLTYSAIAAHLGRRPIDLALLHLTPSQNGACSFGTTADFSPIVAASAKRRIGIVNTAMARPIHTPSLPVDTLDAIVEVHEIPQAPDTRPAGAELQAIAERVAALVPNGATVQTGIGQVPPAIWHALSNHRDLRVWSGIITNAFLGAMDAGATAPSGHMTGTAYGNAAFHGRLEATEQIFFADVRTTHAAARLATIERLVAVNSALEVDLFGQANLEWQSGRLISGVGGAPDFNMAARNSPGGRSIIAMPATAKGGSISRISLRLGAPTVSLGRAELDTVVTEFGVAVLGHLSMDQKAEALTAIAAPEHRDALANDWAKARGHM